MFDPSVQINFAKYFERLEGLVPRRCKDRLRKKKLYLMRGEEQYTRQYAAAREQPD